MRSLRYPPWIVRGSRSRCRVAAPTEPLRRPTEAGTPGCWPSRPGWLRLFSSPPGDDIYGVGFSAAQKAVDATTQPKVNLLNGASRISTEDSNLGIQLGASGVFVDNGDVAINVANYKLSFRTSYLEIEVSASAGTGDSEDVTMTVSFIRSK